jgi:hypothetical protein
MSIIVTHLVSYSHFLSIIFICFPFFSPIFTYSDLMSLFISYFHLLSSFLTYSHLLSLALTKSNFLRLWTALHPRPYFHPDWWRPMSWRLWQTLAADRSNPGSRSGRSYLLATEKAQPLWIITKQFWSGIICKLLFQTDPLSNQWQGLAEPNQCSIA